MIFLSARVNVVNLKLYNLLSFKVIINDERLREVWVEVVVDNLCLANKRVL